MRHCVICVVRKECDLVEMSGRCKRQRSTIRLALLDAIDMTFEAAGKMTISDINSHILKKNGLSE